MKKILLILFFVGFSLSASAQQNGFNAPVKRGFSQGGFSGSAPGLSSVADARTYRDDAWVVLEGNIIRQVGHELYEFRDSSGSVYVDIDYKRWMGQTVSPESKVRIEGEVEKDWNSLEIDVKNLQLVN